ncbi:hypothetical protein FOZ63_026586 [Perkinsus olseni]|uniref:Uncharacterized protein n=1 Tax=Perkinsus olseni TaxID=32597 RepID=A0A7J6TKW5_PEROL|nr:hypothetical protein FOZ63_026586 [Perkinsus olseni]
MEGTSFSRILADAAKIKGAQSSAKRKRFESWPVLLQYTAFMGHEQENQSPVFVNEDSFDNLRALPYPERLEAARRLKNEATDYYTRGEYLLAMNRYSQAAGLFYYARILNANWRREGLNDDYLEVVTDIGQSEEEQARVRELRVQCYSNIAMCQMKLGKEMLPEACRTCDVILQLESTNVKAMFRKAKCLVEPASSGDAEVDEAIKLLVRAREVDPNNTEIAVFLRRLQSERARKRSDEKKAYSGWCTRGSLSLENALSKGCDDGHSNSGPLETDDEKLHEAVQSRLKDAQLLRDLYLSGGEKEKAVRMEAYIKQLRQKQRAYSRSCEATKMMTSRLAKTGQLLDDTVRHEVMDRFGLDLKDPIVSEELRRFESLKENNAFPISQEAPGCTQWMRNNIDQPKEEEFREELERLKAESEHALHERHPWITRLANMSTTEQFALGLVFMLAIHFKLPYLILIQIPQAAIRGILDGLYRLLWSTTTSGSIFQPGVDNITQWLHDS